MGRDKWERKLVCFQLETQLPVVVFGDKRDVCVGTMLG
jgi:hypothetical protein